MAETTEVKVERSIDTIIDEAQRKIENLINKTLGSKFIPIFSCGTCRGISLGYNGGEWGLTRKPNRIAKFLASFDDYGYNYSPFATFNNPVNRKGNFVPIEIKLKEEKYLKQIEKFAEAYQSLTGQKSKIITGF